MAPVLFFVTRGVFLVGVGFWFWFSVDYFSHLWLYVGEGAGSMQKIGQKKKRKF